MTKTAIAPERHAELFGRVMRHGSNAIQDEQERRDMGELVGSQGGYLVPTGFLDDLVLSLQYSNASLALSRYWLSGNGAPANYPVVNDTAQVAVKQVENAQVAESDIPITQVQFGATPLWSLPDLIRLSRALIADSGIDLERLLMQAFLARLTRGLDASFIPAIVAAAPAGNTKVTAANNALDYAAIADTFYALDAAYRNSTTTAWVMHPNTAKAVMDVTDASGRRVFADTAYGKISEEWTPGEAGSLPPGVGRQIRTQRIFGVPVLESRNVPQIGASNNVMLLADFSRAFVVRIAEQPELIRLQERYSEYGEIAFNGFARVDGAVGLTDAIALLQMHS